MKINRSKWYLDLLVFVLLSTLNLISFNNYSYTLLSDHVGRGASYTLFLLLFDDLFGDFAGIIIWQFVAFIFLFIGIRKIIKMRIERNKIDK
jgi:hypothetical protein